MLKKLLNKQKFDRDNFVEELLNTDFDPVKIEKMQNV